MAIAFTPRKWEYVLKADRGLSEDQKTYFMIRTLTAREMADIEDSIKFRVDSKAMKALAAEGKTAKGNEEGIHAEPIESEGMVEMDMRAGSKVASILRMGLVGWRNFKDAEGKEVKYVEPDVTGMCHWDNLNQITPEDRHELAGVIEDGNDVSEEEEKN